MPDPSANSKSSVPAPPSKPRTVCPPFSPQALERQMAFDQGARWLLVAGLALLLMPLFAATLLGIDVDAGGGVSPLALIVLAIWFALSVGQGAVNRRLARVTQLMDVDPAEAESELALALKKKALPRTLRMLLHHRLALLRHRQGRFAEVAAICHALLARHLGAAEAVRTHLLLMLIESRLNSHDAGGAYQAMLALHQQPRTLMETLQLTAMQTRYEVMLGYDEAALTDVEKKIRLAELMPAPQCGLMHAMLAAAAQRTRRATLAQWLRRRTLLLCTPQQVEAMGQLWQPNDGDAQA